MKVILGFAMAMSGYGCICCMPMIDKAINYSPVEAVVLATQVDCYIAFRTSYDRKSTNCDVNSDHFRQTGYSASDLRQTVTVQFSLPSAEGMPKTGRAEIKGKDIAERYKVGETITVYSRKNDPSKFRL